MIRNNPGHPRHLRVADPEAEAQRAEALAGIRDLEAGEHRYRLANVLLADPAASRALVDGDPVTLYARLQSALGFAHASEGTSAP